MSDNSRVPTQLEHHVTPLNTTDPAGDIADLQPLRPHFENRRVIGLGEATHGTREIFQLKHRIIRFLVEELDLELVGLEANFSETLAINDYIVREEGDPRKALEGVYFWTWYTEEVLALIEWLRAINRDRPAEDRVRFYGFDAQFTAGPVAALESYLDAVGYHEEGVRTMLPAVDDRGRTASQDDDVDRLLDAADRLVPELEDVLQDRESEFVAATDRRSWQLARRHLRTIVQARNRKRAIAEDDLAAAMAVRDRAMAENVSWILEHEAADRMALWAHNAHVNRLESRAKGHAVPSMGAHLAERYGDEYYALGFEFGGGRFRGLAEPEGSGDADAGLQFGEHAIESALPGTAGDAFSSFNGPHFLLDIASARADPVVMDWLDSVRGLHSIGAVYRPDDPDDHFEPYPLGAAFDGLCYLEETSPARPLEQE